MHRHTGLRFVLLGALLALATACATIPGLPEGQGVSPVTTTAMRQTQQLYLYPDRLDRRVMIGALDALEKSFDSVRFQADEGARHGTLRVGDQSARVPLDSDLDPDRFDATLGRALVFVEQGLGDEANRDEDSDLELIALRGALGALDRYSTVFSGGGTEDFQIRFSGKLKGIGARIGRRDGHLVAMRVFPTSPAAKAGLEDGDAILAIDGDPTRPLTVREAVGKIRGEAGTTVVLSILRAEKEREVPIERGEVTVPSVEARELDKGIGYARITTVSRSTVDEFKAKVQAMGSLSGLVLDLRGNTGGSMMAAASLADLFLEEGVIVRIVDRDGDATGSRSRAMARPGILFGAQVVVLVDPSTASAAEILSGAIAPLSRVTLVGQTTFGKGLIQRVMPLPEENLLKLTVGEYLLSGDRAIHEIGIDPDVLLHPVATDNLGALADVPEGALPYLRKRGEDDTFPIDFGLELIRSGRTRGEAQARERTAAEIQKELEPFGVTWPGDSSIAELELTPPTVEASAPPLVMGVGTTVQLVVTNPNSVALPDAWLSLKGPALYLRNRIGPLGTIPAHGTAQTQIELTPSESLSIDPLGITVLVAAGSQSLASQTAELAVERRQPELQIDVARLDADTIEVTVLNLGCCDPGEVRVAVPGAVRSFESLPPNAPETLELPLTGKVKTVSVLLSGAGVQRRIDVPLPEERITVIPPALDLERGTARLGRYHVEVRAQSPEGLRHGWLALDGQKENYVAWNGSAEGLLRVELGDGDHDVTTKIETLSGVSVIDIRHFTAN